MSDATHPAGRISVATTTDANRPSEASFRNLMLWTLDEANMHNIPASANLT